jgi:hypothetical protein
MIILTDLRYFSDYGGVFLRFIDLYFLKYEDYGSHTV